MTQDDDATGNSQDEVPSMSAGMCLQQTLWSYNLY